MFQSQGSYIYVFLCIALVLFFAQEEHFNKENILPYLCLLLFMVHLPLFYAADSYPENAIKQMISLLLSGWCIFKPISDNLKKEKNKE